jgi:hypothetical protein
MNVLSNHELAFFKTNGYVILKGALDLDGCRNARGLLWSTLPEGSQIRRDDPTTHLGPFNEADSNDDVLDLRVGFRWQLRRIGTHPALIDLVFCDRLVAAAEALLGAGTLRAPVPDGTPMGTKGAAWPGGPVDPALGTEGIRGIYATLPYGEHRAQGPGCHTDGHPFNLGIVGLIDDVPPEGGAFQVWPGSHRRLYPTFLMQYDQPRIPYYDHLPSHKGILHTPEYEAELARVIGDTEPVDCCGEAGDVVLWHHRLAHAAGHNHTNVIRQAVLYDFTKTDLDTCRMDPPQADMWHDWSLELRESDGVYPSTMDRSQRPAL